MIGDRFSNHANADLNGFRMHGLCDIVRLRHGSSAKRNHGMNANIVASAVIDYVVPLTIGKTITVLHR